MKAIILGGGVGRRLRPLTYEIPKSMIEVGGKALIEHMLSNLQKCGIKEVVIGIGHLGHKIKEKIGNEFKGMKIEYAENPIDYKTGNMYSLWLAKRKFDDDFVFLDADLLYTPDMLKKLIDSEHKNAILVSKLDRDTGEEVKVYGKYGKATNIGKKHEKDKNLVGEAVGIVKFSKEVGRILDEEMKKLIKANKLNLEHEDFTQKMCDKGIVNHVFVSDKSWIEIDFLEDLEKARKEIFPLIKDKL